MKKLISKIYLGIVFLFLYAPILVMIFFSFNSTKSKTIFSGFSFRWYEALFRDEILMEALLNTLLIAVLSSVAATILGTAAAIGIHNLSKRVKGVVMNVSNLPIINPEIVTGVSLLLLFVFIMDPLGLDLGFVTVLLAHIVFNTPYVILNVMPRIRNMNVNLYEAALDLGCVPSAAFRKVVLPEIFPGVFAGFLMAFTFSLDDFIISYFTSGTFQTLPIYIYGLLKKPIPLSINALSALLFIIVILTLLLMNLKDTRASRKSQLAYENEKQK
ncbi:MAG: ABC transporter permease [Oscillospiraceae bacterium]|nr:ABC transporter permease [Oscillospiraceae bacterium]